MRYFIICPVCKWDAINVEVRETVIRKSQYMEDEYTGRIVLVEEEDVEIVDVPEIVFNHVSGRQCTYTPTSLHFKDRYDLIRQFLMDKKVDLKRLGGPRNLGDIDIIGEFVLDEKADKNDSYDEDDDDDDDYDDDIDE